MQISDEFDESFQNNSGIRRQIGKKILRIKPENLLKLEALTNVI